MKKIIGAFFTVFGFVINSIILCGLMIIGLDLINRRNEDKKASAENLEK